MRHVRILSTAVVLALMVPAAAHAQVVYKLQSIAKLGDTLAGIKTRSQQGAGDWEIGALNDNGQMTLVTENEAGGEVLLQYSGGQFIPIFVGGQSAPGGGQWSPAFENGPLSPIHMNQAGNVAFAANVLLSNGATVVESFLWDSKSQKTTALALPGMPAVNNLTYTAGGNYIPVINGSNQIAFPAGVKNSAGSTKYGLFLLGSDGKLQAIVLPDQVLPDGSTVDGVGAPYPSINDSGAVAFRLQRANDNSQYSAYLWDQSTITPLAVVGGDAPGGGKFAAIRVARVNNKDKSVLLLARVDSTGNPDGIYRSQAGKLTALVVPGQAMPGGGKFSSLQQNLYGVSFPSANGQYAFQATLDDGSTAAYLLDTDGTVSLILKEGATTNLGTITQIGDTGSSSFGVGVNGKGQVALVATIDRGAPSVLVLSPSGP